MTGPENNQMDIGQSYVDPYSFGLSCSAAVFCGMLFIFDIYLEFIPKLDKIYKVM